MSDPHPMPFATAADLIALGDVRAEIIDGIIVPKEAARYEHGAAQLGIGSAVHRRFLGPPGSGGRPGGWWMITEAEVAYEPHQVYRHDLAGWRRERVPEKPTGRALTILPDWVCEILSPSNASNDTVKKFRTLHRHHVPHYWIANVDEGVLSVYEWEEKGYLLVVVAEPGERLRLPPFDAVELDVAVLFGADPPAEG